MKKGVLLINLGTPSAPDRRSVRAYLREFLSDPRVVDLPFPLRQWLLYGVILPFRTSKTTSAYQRIWTDKGSPLLMHSQNLRDALQRLAGDAFQVELGMRYGKPHLNDALFALKHCEHLTVIPLYPQYASATTGSSLEAVFQYVAKQAVMPSLSVVRDFYQNPSYIHAQAEHIKPYLTNSEHVILSYHGLPERQLTPAGCASVCKTPCSLHAPQRACYRRQCYATSQRLTAALGLQESDVTTAFQSRLGKTPWIQPYTDATLTMLAKQGIKRIAIACPSFVADCLETLEEIGMRAKAHWQRLGGDTFTLIPCLNDDEAFVHVLLEMVKGAS